MFKKYKDVNRIKIENVQNIYIIKVIYCTFRLVFRRVLLVLGNFIMKNLFLQNVSYSQEGTKFSLPYYLA